MRPVNTVRYVRLLFLIGLIPFSSAFTQVSDSHAHELDARVPVLSEFHEVIYQIWHTAWPEKNIPMLAELLPEVKQYCDSLSRVTLSGILRDKQDAWNQGTASLQKTAQEYERAATASDSVKLLEAAERLHAQYEMLVRIIRPVTEEIDQFHQVLYMIYHHYWPNRNMETLVPAVSSLKDKMSALSASSLPNRLKAKQAEYDAATMKLSKAVEALTKVDPAKDPKTFDAQLDAVHSHYQSLEKVFD